MQHPNIEWIVDIEPTIMQNKKQPQQNNGC
jgi:hypothetical protein